MTLGSIFRFDASSAFASLAAKHPNGAMLATLPDIAPLPGGVFIKAGDEVIAALGVAGSPGGDKDEISGRASVASIQRDIAARSCVNGKRSQMRLIILIELGLQQLVDRHWRG